MRLLLDTNLLVWAFTQPSRLGAALGEVLEDLGNEVLFSAASIWEIAIKTALGRADFAVEPSALLRRALDAGFIELPIHASIALRVAELPLHHRDPFDRLLIAQAIAEPARFFTSDLLLPRYSELVTLVD